MKQTMFYQKSSESELDNSIIWSRGFFNTNGSYARKQSEDISNENEIINIIKSSKNYVWIRLGSPNTKNNLKDLDFFSNNLYLLDEEVILVTGDGDSSVPSDLNQDTVKRILDCPKIKHWFTQNYDGSLINSKLHPYPIGFDLHCQRDHTLNTPEKIISYMNNLNKNNSKKEFKILCDVHLTPRNRISNCRLVIADTFKEKKVDHIDLLLKKIPSSIIYNLYSNYTFVISAHGNGLDCHRTWEILYLGGIVITKKSSLDYLYKGLPVAIINDWKECLNKDNLYLWYDSLKKFTEREYIKEKFYQKNWLAN